MNSCDLWLSAVGRSTGAQSALLLPSRSIWEHRTIPRGLSSFLEALTTVAFWAPSIQQQKTPAMEQGEQTEALAFQLILQVS